MKAAERVERVIPAAEEGKAFAQIDNICGVMT